MNWKTSFITPIILASLCTGCGTQSPQSSTQQTLTQARQGFKTVLTEQTTAREPVEKPGSNFSVMKYPSEVGELSAYVTSPGSTDHKFPAIVWITGGDCNTIGDVWSPAPRENDQTAAAYRNKKIVMMFPSLRGGNDNPGRKEGFLGEVNDVIAATKYLEKLPHVDPKRIYLGGHSTGGTLALLVAQLSNRYRGVFSFGPVEDVSGYGADSGFLPFDLGNEREVQLRSPGYWLSSVQSPTWVIEGASGTGNIDSLRTMKNSASNPLLHFIEVNGADHFSVLAPVNELIAQKIVADTGSKSSLSLTEEEVNARVAQK